MKRIKNLKHLKEEKKNLQLRRKELEDQLQNDWQEVKSMLHIKNLTKAIARSMLDKKTSSYISDNSILESTLSFGAALAANRFAKKAGKKFKSIFKKS